jgi:hypothetical protein
MAVRACWVLQNSCQGTASGKIDSDKYGLRPRPISAGETRFAPQRGEIRWSLWLGLIGGAIVLYGLGFAIFERRRLRARETGRSD